MIDNINSLQIQQLHLNTAFRDSPNLQLLNQPTALPLGNYDPTTNSIKKFRKKPFFKPHSKWTIEEDETLKQLVLKFGDKNWRHLAKSMEGRNSRQCRERWQYYLDPNLKKDNWSFEEDQLIVQKFKEYGPKWKQMETFFQNRTDAMIKNRFHVLERQGKKTREMSVQLMNKNFLFKEFKPNTLIQNTKEQNDPYQDIFENSTLLDDFKLDISDAEDLCSWDFFEEGDCFHI